jgi:UDPglucose--hexose-1-phosphate uridylyltransferase
MDYKFVEDEKGNWTILAPKRAKRPHGVSGTDSYCPFCVGKIEKQEEVYRIGGKENWKVIVVKNSFPFAPVHEVIVHSPDHHKTFEELPISQSEEILKAFRDRYNEHKDKGSVVIFNNHGESAGESLPHPHSQLVVIPSQVKLGLPHHEPSNKDKAKETSLFTIFSPKQSQWPDEVWLYPKERNKTFGEISDNEIKDLAKSLYRLIQIMDLRHGHEFPYNFIIYPYNDWYLRLAPRYKTTGGFEVGTGVFVNTQDTNETMEFIIEHFDRPDEQKIKSTHRASYRRGV